MKHFISIILMALFCINAWASTQVSGNITANTTYTLSNSPYIVTSNLTVQQGFTLSIESGVTIQVANSVSINIYGTISGDNVTFTSNEVSPSPGDWNTITVHNSNSIKGELILTNSNILYPRTINNYGSTNLSNTNISFSSYGAINNTSGSDLTYTNGSISTNSPGAKSSYSGIAVSTNSSAQISNVTISDYKYGINQGGGSNTTLDNLDISECVNALYLNTNDTVSISNSTFHSNTTPIYFSSVAKMTLGTNNDFTGNTYDRVEIYISSTTSDFHLPYAEIPYYFSRSMTINSGAELSIASNNTLKFADYRGITLNNSTIQAIGATDEYIYFTSTRDDNWGGDSNNDESATYPTSNHWYGIVLNGSSSSNSTIDRCQIRYAGYNGGGALNINSNSNPSISNSNFNNNYYGIKITGASAPTISNCEIGSSYLTPIAMSFEANPTFLNNQLSFSDNQYDAIGLLGGTLTADATIIQHSFTDIDNITYFMLDKITIPQDKTLTINPGVVIKSDGGNKNIIVEGKLLANGTSEENIVFTSVKDDNHGNPGDTNKDGTITTPTIGNFSGIVFSPTSSDSSSISYAEIKYANAYSTYYYSQSMNEAAIITANASPIIENNTFSNVNEAIRCYEASNPIINNNHVTNTTRTPFSISVSADPTFTNNSFANTGMVALGLLGGNVTQNGTIRNRTIAEYDNITMVLLNNMTIKQGTYVDVEPGSVIKSQSQTIYIQGGFKTSGTSSQKVIFTSIKDDNHGNPGDTNGDGNSTSPGNRDWNSIQFEESSDDSYCMIDHTILRYAGYQYSSYYNAIIETHNANPTIQNSTLGQGYTYAISIEGNSAPTIDNVIIENCNWEPIGMSLTSDPSFDRMTFTANRAKGLAIIDRTLSSDANLAQRNVAGINNIAYILNSALTIAPSAVLSINPGVNIKSRGQYIYIDGALIANGLLNEKIVFTSINDDSSGGDTNDDGNSSVPSAGNWSGLQFRASDLDSLNSLKNVDIRYTNRAISFDDSRGSVDSCTIEQVSGWALTISGSASPSFTDNQFFNLQSTPVGMSMFSSPTFEGNTMANVAISAIEIMPETYSQSDEFTFRNFAGIDSITYYMNGTYTINDGTAISIPKGMVFKTGKSYSSYSYSQAKFIVNGKLLIEGDDSAPVVFTDYYDDTYGNPKDIGTDGDIDYNRYNTNWITFNNVSNDSSIVNYAHFNRVTNALILNSASPSLSNNYFTNGSKAITSKGVSEPSIIENTFHDLSESPISISLVAYPQVTSGNIISGTTYKTIEVNSETLTQDATLIQRNFGGIDDIPYLFNNYTVGTGAILTIDPGVICKFKTGHGIEVQKGLIAEGGNSNDEKIIFANINNDFYGGDSNSDGESEANYWLGIEFQNTSIDAVSRISNAIISDCTYSYGSYGGVSTKSASPTIKNTVFNNSAYAINITGASKPIIDSCDFVEISVKAINNQDQTFEVDATNCWWGDNSGPEHTSNIGGQGYSISDGINYSPWINNGILNPLLGDASLNGTIKAYDASLIMQHTVGSITLDERQQKVSDVSGNGGVDAISAYDASLILQYVVGMQNYFEANERKSTRVSIAELSIDDTRVEPGQTFSLPISFDNLNANALQAVLNYDSEVLNLEEITPSEDLENASFYQRIDDNKISISVASTSKLQSDGILAYLEFSVKEDTEQTNSYVNILKFLANEDDKTLAARSGQVIVTNPTNLENIANTNSSINAYPNPFQGTLNIEIKLDNSEFVNIDIYNVYGQLVHSLVNNELSAGTHQLQWNGEDNLNTKNGLYIIKLKSESLEQVIKVNKF